MAKSFNTTGDCKPGIHYMVDLTKKLEEIKEMVDKGQYFTINRARQYGKTTTLKALKRYLENEYLVIRLDFQRLSHACFETQARFVKSFSTELLERGPIILTISSSGRGICSAITSIRRRGVGLKKSASVVGY